MNEVMFAKSSFYTVCDTDMRVALVHLSNSSQEIN